MLVCAKGQGKPPEAAMLSLWGGAACVFSQLRDEEASGSPDRSCCFSFPNWTLQSSIGEKAGLGPSPLPKQRGNVSLQLSQ